VYASRPSNNSDSMRARGSMALSLLVASLATGTLASCSQSLANWPKPSRSSETGAADSVGHPPPNVARSPDAARKGARPYERTAEYKGKTIVWNDAVDPPRLWIGGKPIGVYKSVSGGELQYGADILIYAMYPSLLRLAQALIDTNAGGAFR
jgi:hypothetical protein